MNEKIKWAPRITPILLERLYKSDALGMQDTRLCDDVAYRLYLRCQAILMVPRDEVACARCENVFTIDTSSDEIRLAGDHADDDETKKREMT